MSALATSNDQLAFDLSEPLPEWTGSPLRYHTDYLAPDAHLEAWARWQEEHGAFASCPRSHMWHRNMCSDTFHTANGHSIHMLIADCRDRDDPLALPLDHSVPRKLMYQAICAICEWHAIRDSENGAVEAWHDHAFPGWRDLPVRPLKLRRPDAWVEANYPPEWQQQGCPIRTTRGPIAGRHVGGQSPWGGFDLAHWTDETSDRRILKP